LQEVSWEVTPMQMTVALRGRTRLAALLRDLEQEADHKDKEWGPAVTAGIGGPGGR
jgi:hypothetical protein